MMRLATLADLDRMFVEEMSNEISRDFIRLFMSEETIGTADELSSQVEDQPFAFAVMMKRLVMANPKFRYSLQTILMTLLLAPNVGSVVMWAYTLTEETAKRGVITMKVLADLFPLGFPTEDGYHRMWDAQKHLDGARDNWLDTEAAWIQPKL